FEWHNASGQVIATENLDLNNLAGQSSWPEGAFRRLLISITTPNVETSEPVSLYLAVLPRGGQDLAYRRGIWPTKNTKFLLGTVLVG
ncbi:MAG: hypothetical protein ACYC6L_06290, partial [Anaerolineae bacterium]